MKTVQDAVKEIADKYEADILKCVGDDFAIRVMLKAAVIDGYAAGQDAAIQIVDKQLGECHAEY